MTITAPEQAAVLTTAGAATLWVDQAAAAATATAGRATAYAAQLLQQFSGWYSPAEIEAMSAELAALSINAQSAVSSMMAEYVAQTVSLLTGRPVATPRLDPPLIRNGVPLEVVHQRPITAYRVEYADSRSTAAALDAAIERELQILEDDIMLAIRESEMSAMEDLEVTHYRRVLRPERSKSGSCLLCVAASLQVYSIEDLLPIHNGCQCIVMPVVDGQDPGDELNEEDRRRAYKEAGTTNKGDLRKLRVKVREHGELGPVLTDAGHRFTGADDIGITAGDGRLSGQFGEPAVPSGGGSDDEPPTAPTRTADDGGGDRFLPADEHRTLDPAGTLGSDPKVVPVADMQLAPVDDADRYFRIARDDARGPKPAVVTRREISVATWLRRRGYDITSVAEADQVSRPDAVAARNGVRVGLEFKHLDVATAGAVGDHLRDAKRSTRHVVIDARDLDAPLAEIVAAVEEAGRRRGGHFLEVLLLVAGGEDGTGVLWTPS